MLGWLPLRPSTLQSQCGLTLYPSAAKGGSCGCQGAENTHFLSRFQASHTKPLLLATGKAGQGPDRPLSGDLARQPEAKAWTAGCVTFDM